MDRVVTIYGASHGLGLATAVHLVKSGFFVELVGRDFSFASRVFDNEEIGMQNFKFIKHDFLKDGMSELFSKVHCRAHAVFYTAGICKIEHFSDCDEHYIEACYKINTQIPTVLIKRYYYQLLGSQDFFFGCVTSISGQISSPLLSVYSASKAGMSRLIESINAELLALGSKNRITDFCPGHFPGSSLFGRETKLSQLVDISSQLIDSTLSKKIFFIPNYHEVYKDVLMRYHADREAFGLSSYQHKIKRRSDLDEGLN